MSDESATLVELLLSAEQFCGAMKVLSSDRPPSFESNELRSKILQCQTVLAELQASYEKNELTIESALVRGNFRSAIMLLMWIAFYGRSLIDFKLFRKLVMIESAFTYLLVSK